MAEIVFSREAVDDLSEIYLYSAKTWSVLQADKYAHLIKSACDDIVAHRKRGRDFSDVTENLLGYKVGKHIIFYRLNIKGMHVIRILHERMDYHNRL